VAKTMGVASAFLAAGLLLRPITAPPPSPAAATRSAGGSIHSAAGVSSNQQEGPWLASCKYWAAVRGMDSASKATSDGSCPIEPAGDDKRWGVPPDVGSMRPKIHVIIAAVPDPIHTHLALQFDRDIDALVQAAGDNEYVPSYYWLPWQKPAATPVEGSVSREGADQDPARERQPGLIVFKHVPKPGEEGYPWSNYFDVIYLFLVGETPTVGTDGTQLRNAFQAEVELHRAAPRATFSMKGPNEVAIIGSNASGSAASLREGIDAAHLALESASRLRLDVNIAGSTSTDLANDLLSENSLQGKRAKHAEGDVKYISFGDNTNFEIQQLLSALSCSGHHLERVALLFEDSTVFGASGAAKAGNPSNAKPQQSQSLPLQHAACTQIVDSTIGSPVIIRFPREISLLRNAHADGDDQPDSHAKSVPSPFLHLSLKDPGANDTVPQFSSEDTPLSQEAQLMAIGRQLQRNHTEFIVINASNVLDQIFLAQFLRRACPDARLVLPGGDLLYEREAQNTPFIGAVSFSPYGLMSLTSSGRQGSPAPVRAFADSTTEAYFNAASFTFWNGKATSLHLANYFNPLQPGSSRHASLWETTIGTDGYYPLAIVDDCASNVPLILPTISSPSLANPHVCEAAADTGSGSVLRSIAESLHAKGGDRSGHPYRYPAQSWQALCILIGLLCLVHAAAVSFPNYWSPLTRDLAIAEGDQRHRRSMYIYIGSTMLFCMAFLTGYPIYPCFRLFHPSWQIASYSLWVLVTGTIALIATLRKTYKYLWPRDVQEQIADKNSIFLVNIIATVSLVAVPFLWATICNTEQVDKQYKQYSYVGTFFSYRCLHPGSGVSPLVPVLLILFGWYLWSVFQTLRLRFSEKNRPRLPESVPCKGPWQLFVSDADISRSAGAQDSCLTSNISCLLITREALRRSFPEKKWWPTLAPILVYLVLLFSLVFWVKLESLDRILWQPKNGPTMYELLLDVLALPLVVIAFAGWLRVMLIWGSLKRGLLERLEQLPIRFAFARLNGVGWMSMLRQGGLAEQWRDMARSTESMRQMIHDPALLEKLTPVQRKNLKRVQRELDEWIRRLLMVIGKKSEKNALPLPQQEFASFRCTVVNKQATVSSQEEGSVGLKCMVQVEESDDFPREVEVSTKYKVEIDKLATFSGAKQQGHLNPAAETDISQLLSEEKEQASLRCIFEIEKRYAEFGELLLGGVLIPYWELARTGPVEGEDLNHLPIKAPAKDEAASKSHVPLQLHTSAVADEPMYIRVAEEFLAIRYVSLIRAVLVNMRYLLVFVSAIFVLMIVAWNSYPFQPRQLIDEVFTGLLLLLTAGIGWVFAQMHRNPILSRITDTSANELGFDFYVRLVTFGAVPVLTWLAYQFPELGGSLFKFIQPGLEVFK
jgi:hypothetical protein